MKTLANIVYHTGQTLYSLLLAFAACAVMYGLYETFHKARVMDAVKAISAIIGGGVIAWSLIAAYVWAERKRGES